MKREIQDIEKDIERRLEMSSNLNDLEMAKKRNHKIMITDEAINKVPRVQYKEIPEQNMIIFWNWQDKSYRFPKMKMILTK